MCFYARTDYNCGDWKWGNMMERCPLQHRIGETCGRKFLAQEHLRVEPDDCKICREIEVKQRRRQRLSDNINRWASEGDKFEASLAKARSDRAELDEKIQELVNSRPLVRMSKDGGGGEGPGTGQAIPSMATLTQQPSQMSGYQYTTSQERPMPETSAPSAYSMQRGQPAQTPVARPPVISSRHSAQYRQVQRRH